ncbi:MAG: formimidoyltetrahydrofolate cyclodeaminase [Desulfarculus sp.]|jgi:formiminotetrahydrofolate cyclodeaminase|nr:MAG: formimidoyltetrahydrofolate cyclodeaminase [Desulfarculus sp.]
MAQQVYDMKVSDFIEIAASKSHTPGGGNVSAVVATLGASMVAMVGNLTLSNKKYEEVKDRAQASVDRVMDMIAKLKELTIKDIEAFDAYMAVFRMPKDTEEQKKARAQAMQDAAKAATLVPLEICQTCLAVVQEAEDLSKYGNLMAISDVGVGAMVAEAALRSCMLSVDINLPSIKDQAFVDKVQGEKARLFTRAEKMRTLAMARVIEKMG